MLTSLPFGSRPMILMALMVAIVFAPILKAEDQEDNAKPFIVSPVSPKKSIRFYTANSQLQANKVNLTGGDIDAVGCHNMLRKTKVFKSLQIGFGVCSLYAKKDCNIDSLVPVQSEKRIYATYVMSEGIGWLPQSEDERGVKVASWSCTMDIEDGELRFETRLAKTEKKRMKFEHVLAAERLAEAQAEFNQIEKAARKADEYEEFARDEAIDRGLIEPNENECEDEEVEESGDRETTDADPDVEDCESENEEESSTSSNRSKL